MPLIRRARSRTLVLTLSVPVPLYRALRWAARILRLALCAAFAGYAALEADVIPGYWRTHTWDSAWHVVGAVAGCGCGLWLARECWPFRRRG
jgi:hypothetical protein